MGRIKAIALAMMFALLGVVTPPSLAQTTGQVLTNDTLSTMLDGLGYEPKALSKGYLVTIKQDTWTIAVQLVISPDGGKIGLNANLGEVPDLDAVPAKKWLGLLQANGEIDPSTFYIAKDQKKLYLHRVIDNRDVTPAFLRKQVEAFVGNIRSTEETWDLTN